ncbi:hypothetical protein CORC01_02732 [Colletotrichum orchidophilum]|uniref:Uncharacterized protein n=1 Tax=Colletotrichum orchidophilum TaxID=1209926 RepID=A0A1G4BKB4_9PEZI|nr:uncharacterized protein CORC01_02732 [Colletotrichum orchidophilum]OHF01854.1 hypothetical protein CORC01_02732 [Colletotrichum orchidophilum]
MASTCLATVYATSISSHLHKPSRSKCVTHPDLIGLPRLSTLEPTRKTTYPNSVEVCLLYRTKGEGGCTAPIRPRHVSPSPPGDPPFVRSTGGRPVFALDAGGCRSDWSPWDQPFYLIAESEWHMV